MSVSKKINQIPDDEKSPLVLSLIEIIQLQQETIQALKDEVARLKGTNQKPKVPPSNLGKKKKKKARGKKSMRAGSEKRSKTRSIEIHETVPAKPDFVPAGSVFKDHHPYTVQDLVVKPHNTVYLIERWEGPNGEYIVGKLPEHVEGHFGKALKCFILHQYYHCHVTQPLIYEQLLDMGIDISKGKISEILVEDKDAFHLEKEEILRAGLETASHVNVDDTGARHDGKNGYCTHVGNEGFAYFESTESKSRINFLKILRAGYKDYVLNVDALCYMDDRGLPKKILRALASRENTFLSDEDAWNGFLKDLGITGARHVQIATEGVLVGSLMEHGFNSDLVIVSDDAGQFNVFLHALCWIHAERSVNKLTGFNEKQRQALEDKKSEIWKFYEKLKKYKESPTKRRRSFIEKRFDEIFLEKTDFATLNEALRRIHANKDELLLVLKRPDIPLHNNLSENDIREYVKKRKISGSTRSPTGRKCRDTFASLKKTCRKQGISFWEYLMDRLSGARRGVPYLPDLIRGVCPKAS
jgi:hypothetical protein